MIAPKPAYRADEPARAEFLPFGVPAFDEAEVDAMSSVLRSKWIGTWRPVLHTLGEVSRDRRTRAAHSPGAICCNYEV